MLLSSRTLRRSMLCFVCMIPGVCSAQANQFQNVVKVQPTTGGRVMSFTTGIFQQPPEGTDILYVAAPVVSGTTSSITVGELLNEGGAGFADLGENQIVFQGVSNVVAAERNFLGSGFGYVFALTPTVPGTPNLCLYAGTGAQPPSLINPMGGGSSYSGGHAYPPIAGTSGCMTLPTLGASAARFDYAAGFAFKAGLSSQLILEDSANSTLYILSFNAASANNGVLSGVVVTSMIAIPPADGAGPIYVGDFNGDGKMDFIVNNQAGGAATVYLGDGVGGVAVPPARYVFDAGVRSMLMQDMDGDGIADMVVEGNSGAIEIHKGSADGSFAISSEGGTALTPGSAAGEGGRLAVINPRTLDILTTTPIGMSLLQRQNGTLVYALKTIYNIGPGRTSFALVDFHVTGNLDLAVDSAEGVAILSGNADGTFQASKAYSALAPGLSATVGRFRNATNNPTGIADVVVATGATQAQLLTGNGDGTFNTFAGVVDTGSGPYGNVPAQSWSNILTGDFDGDGNLDVLYSLTGLPQSPPSGDYPVTYLQYGKGDGTFNPAGFYFGFAGYFPGIYGNSAIGDFNGDGLSDLVFSDSDLDAGWLGSQGQHTLLASGFGTLKPISSSFNQVAAGFFKSGRTRQQDLVLQEGSNFIPYVNKQDGTGKNFTAMPALIGPGAPQYASTVLIADIDGDGNGDLVGVYYDTAPNPARTPTSPYQVYIWYGKGDGTFETPAIWYLNRNYSLGAVADMNADGRPDLVLSDGSLVSILFNRGGRDFGGEQHFLAGQGINSLSLADVNGDGVPDLIVANGGATISNALVLGGKTAASISLTANPPDIDTGGITVLLNSITTAPVTGTLTASPEPSAYGAAFTLTAAITPGAGVALPTGAVQFFIDGQTVGGPATLVPGTTNSIASYLVAAGNAYTSSVHPITAYYIGDSANSPITLSGQPGTHAITSGATSAVLYLCVGPAALCPAGYVMPPLSASLTMFYGQFWNGTVVVTASDGGALSGNTVIYDSYNGGPALPICTLKTALGGACPASVGTTVGTTVGTNVITAAYVPGIVDVTHSGSTSNAVTITVLQDTTTATLIGAPNPSPAGQPVTFNATLSGNFAAPTGSVVFTYGSTVLGTIDLVPRAAGVTSTATLTTSVLPVGSDLITVSYAATLDFAAISTTYLETITPSLAGNFTLAVTPTPVSVGVGYSTLFTVTVTPRNGFALGVNLACSNLPSEATCFFDTASLGNGGGTTHLVVATAAPHSCGTTQPYFLGMNGGGSGVMPIALPAIAGLLAMFLPGRRRWLRGLIALIVIAGATQMTGCGTCTDLGTRPAAYTFQVTGSSTGTTEVESQPVTITVTI